MEAKQEEQARQMVELHEQENRLQEENERLRTQMKDGRAEHSREPPCSFSPSRPGKGKEAVAPDDIDLPENDELSSSSSPLPRHSLPPNAAEAQSRKRPPRRSSRSISVARYRVWRDPAWTNDSPCQLTNICLIGLVDSPYQYLPCTCLSGPPSTANDFLLRRSGTTGHALHSPWTAYPGLRSSPWIFHTTFRHVRRFFRSVRSHVTL